MKNITPQEVVAGVKVVIAVGEAIRALKTVSAGKLYAQVSAVIGIDEFLEVIAILKRQGLVRECKATSTLFWIAPPEEVKR